MSLDMVMYNLAKKGSNAYELKRKCNCKRCGVLSNNVKTGNF